MVKVTMILDNPDVQSGLAAVFSAIEEAKLKPTMVKVEDYYGD